MTKSPYIAVEAGLALWGQIRAIAAMSGCSLEESNGLLRRSFVVRGTLEQMTVALKALQQVEGLQ